MCIVVKQLGYLLRIELVKGFDLEALSLLPFKPQTDTAPLSYLLEKRLLQLQLYQLSPLSYYYVES